MPLSYLGMQWRRPSLSPPLQGVTPGEARSHVGGALPYPLHIGLVITRKILWGLFFVHRAGQMLFWHFAVS